MYPEDESVEWVNRVLKQIWIRHAPFIESEIKRIANPEIEMRKPKFLNPIKVELESINLGKVAPIIDTMRIYTTRDNVLEVETMIQFCSNINLMIQIFPTAYPQAKFPLQVSNIIVLAKVRIEAEYSDAFPFIGNVAFTMLERPTINFEAKPFHIGDILPIPGLTPLFYDILHMLIIDQMFLFPNKFLYDLSFLGKMKK